MIANEMSTFGASAQLWTDSVSAKRFETGRTHSSQYVGRRVETFINVRFVYRALYKRVRTKTRIERHDQNYCCAKKMRSIVRVLRCDGNSCVGKTVRRGCSRFVVKVNVIVTQTYRRCLLNTIKAKKKKKKIDRGLGKKKMYYTPKLSKQIIWILESFNDYTMVVESWACYMYTIARVGYNSFSGQRKNYFGASSPKRFKRITWMGRVKESGGICSIRNQKCAKQNFSNNKFNSSFDVSHAPFWFLCPVHASIVASIVDFDYCNVKEWSLFIFSEHFCFLTIKSRTIL